MKNPSSIKGKALITGFQPFGNWSENPSLWVLSRLSQHHSGHCHVLELPVEYDQAANILIETIKSQNPSIVISLGLSGVAKVPMIEELARNYDSATIADNAGVLRLGSVIKPKGPLFLIPNFPRTELIAHLNAQGFLAETSRSAGTYVCNNLFYHVCFNLEKADSLPVPFTFLHIPSPNVWKKENAENFADALANWIAQWLMSGSR